MYISKETLAKLRKKHNDVIVMDGDMSAAFLFVHDVLTAEADALRASAPYATVTIERLERAAYEVYEIDREIENENFSEGG